MGFLRRLRGESKSPTVEVQAWLIEPARPDASVDVVGESNYQPALVAAGGGLTPDGVAQPNQMALLYPEPTNPYDRNAIAIKVGTGTVGYLSRADALAYQPAVQWAQRQGRYLAVKARLTGGWDRGGQDKGSVGCVLHLGTPAETLIDLVMEEKKVRTDHRWAGQVIAFTGDPIARMQGERLDRAAAVLLAQRAGMMVHPRVTKQVQLLVDCDPSGVSGNELKARQYGIPVVTEAEFWSELGVPVERIDWS